MSPTEFLAQLNNTKGQSSQKAVQSATQEASSEAIAGQDTSAASAAESSIQAPQSTFATALEGPSILQVPVTEFSFPAVAALAPGEVSTHTDGAPSPVALSGFSALTEEHDQGSVKAGSHVHDLVGLGIEGIDVPRATTVPEAHLSPAARQADDALSPSGSIMDSPILEDINSEVLTTGPGGMIDLGSVMNAPLDQLMALRDAIEKQINAATLRTVSEPTSTETATEPTVAPSVQPSLVSSTNTSSTPTTAILNGHRENPFTVREPLASNDANIAPPPVAPVVDVKKHVPTSEPPKPATIARPKPFSSNKIIVSKWADEPASRPASRASAQSFRSPSPMIGDSKAFGHPSKEAAKGRGYEAPPARAVPKGKTFHAPGAGYAALLKDLQKMNVNGGNKKN